MGTIDSLSPLTLCCVQVAAISSCPGEPTLSGPLTETCGVTNDTIPGGVTSLTVTGVNREGILITWNPPDNYARSGLEYRVTVSASNFVTIETTLYDQAYYYLGGLEASKEFSVSVLAMTGLGGDSSVQAVGSTLPDPPDPPSNPTLSVVDDNDNVTLELSWQPVETATEYIAVLRCNEEDPIVKNTTSTSTTFTVTDPEERFAWCTSQVQSKNDVGLGQFSELVSIALPTSAPSTPRCFLVDDQGSAIFISFDVTHPFSLNSLLIKYKNIPDFQDANSVDEIVKQFTSTNVLSVNVSRKTHYEFQLRLCNSHGCSEYCDQLMNFTTSSVSNFKLIHTHVHIVVFTHTYCCVHTYIHIVVFTHTYILLCSHIHIVVFTHTLLLCSHIHIVVFTHTYCCVHTYIILLCCVVCHSLYTLYLSNLFYIVLYMHPVVSLGVCHSDLF